MDWLRVKREVIGVPTIRCFDIAEMVLDEATEQFSPIWVVDEEKKGALKQYCDALDILSEEFNGQAFEVDVDEVKMTISIKMFCDEIEVCDETHLLYKLGKVAKSMSFSYSKEDDTMAVEFVFPSIWKKSY